MLQSHIASVVIVVSAPPDKGTEDCYLSWPILIFQNLQISTVKISTILIHLKEYRF